MRLVRTFHPVGHGAFYTERFYDGGACVFTAVYDCGSDTLSGSSLAALISNALHGEHIDVLFLSHFHSDHVNGLSNIKNQCGKIILPVISTEEKNMSYIHNAIVTGRLNNEANNWLDTFSPQNSDVADEQQIIKVHSVRETIEHSNEEPIEIESASTTISAGVPLYSRKVPNWIYLPYNLHHDVNAELIAFFKEKGIIDDTGVNKTQLSAIIEGTAGKDLNLKTIQKKYNEVLNQGNPNQHSMTIYSGYRNCYPYSYMNIRCGCCYDRCHGCISECPFQANCLYTGDFVASESNVENLRKFYEEYLYESTTVQIPHHASANVGRYYGDKIFRYAKIGVISTQFGKYPSMPSNDVVMNIMREGVVPLFVTEDKSSIVEREYYIF